jgi:hypothetical protein
MKNFLPPAYEGKEPKESLQVMFEHIAEDSPGQMGFILELIAEASRDPSIKKLLSEAYQRSLKTTSEFLAKQSKKNVAYSAEDVRRLSVGFMMLQLGLLARNPQNRCKTRMATTDKGYGGRLTTFSLKHRLYLSA